MHDIDDEMPSACKICDNMQDGECCLKECEYETAMNEIKESLEDAFAFMED